MDPSQEAFQAFMLGGSRPTPVQTPSPSMSSRMKQQSSSKKTNKRFTPIFKAYQGRVQEWIDADTQLYEVLNSIANLRDRIWWEENELHRVSIPSKPWATSGYRAQRSPYLLSTDVDMAQTHDLLQHEKMLSGARSLIAGMAKAQDAMGRRLGEFYDLEEVLSIECQTLMHRALHVFQILGDELYRKQVLVKKVLDSCHNGLLVERSLETLNQGSSPRKLVREAYTSWSSNRHCKEEWTVVQNLMEGYQ